jgi:hypothetical protein
MLSRVPLPTVVLWIMFAGLVFTMMLIGRRLGSDFGPPIAFVLAAVVAIPTARVFSRHEGPAH